MTTTATRRSARSRADEQLAAVSIDTLAVGASLRTPIYDDRDDRTVLLLAAGTRLTRLMVDRLKERGVQRVRLSKSELERMTGGTTRPMSKPSLKEEAASVTQSKPMFGHDVATVHEDSFVHHIKRHGAVEFSAERTSEYEKSVDLTVDYVDTFFHSLTDGAPASAQGAVSISEQSLNQITQDLDLFVRLGIRPHSDRYPSRHSTQTAMLAMSIGTTMGLRESDLIELGVGCMVHDVGMLEIDQRVVASGHRLGQVEFLEITKHPVRTFDLIRHIPEISSGARLVAYQLHERYDGSGYPRGRRGKQIHILARIAGVADTFVALVSPRPHRPGMLPYHAMEQMIRETRSGRYDPVVVRALLQTVSLFPLGSFIETSDGRVGTVLRSNGDFYTKPIVQLWRPGNRHQVEVVNMAESSHIDVLRVVEKVDESDTLDNHLNDFWE